jgi:hypothetical protein
MSFDVSLSNGAALALRNLLCERMNQGLPGLSELPLEQPTKFEWSTS